MSECFGIHWILMEKDMELMGSIIEELRAFDDRIASQEICYLWKYEW